MKVRIDGPRTGPAVHRIVLTVAAVLLALLSPGPVREGPGVIA
ncbi:hypothetical protein ACIGW0_10455 [Streptomyces bikiniensis]|uniref:Uncharacterized protein n=1 Tax=Streptomyces bikiniensis TaxID=1896 RepID=A0ABW8CQH0_STRBI